MCQNPRRVGGAQANRIRRRLRQLLVWGAVAGVVAAPIGWGLTDVLERDDDFCNACHLPSGRPLHEARRRDFDLRPPQSLAAAHAAAGIEAEGAAPRAFRCIDCHGGVGLLGRARVKTLAAKDAFWYVTGHFAEPKRMRWPLRDEDCRKCHAHFDEGEVESWQSPRFHQLPVHNADLGVGCVECHLVHEPVPGPQAPGGHFLHASRVRTQCARCHSEFQSD